MNATITASQPPTANLLGEIVAWELATGSTFTHANLVTALGTAGLDPALALTLHPRHAFTRACRKLAAQRIIRNLTDDVMTITFQFTQERRACDRFEYDFEAKLSLDKATGQISCLDPVLQARAQAELSAALDNRTVSDVTRLLQRACQGNADLFPIKASSGVYFVPQKQASFLTKLETFLTALGGRLSRFPVPSGTPSAAASVEAAVSDGLWTTLADFETAFARINHATRDDTLDRAWDKIHAARNMIEDYTMYLGAQKIKLEDHLAYLAKLLRDRAEEARKEETAPVSAAG